MTFTTNQLATSLLLAAAAVNAAPQPLTAGFSVDSTMVGGHSGPHAWMRDDDWNDHAAWAPSQRNGDYDGHNDYDDYSRLVRRDTDAVSSRHLRRRYAGYGAYSDGSDSDSYAADYRQSLRVGTQDYDRYHRLVRRSHSDSHRHRCRRHRHHHSEDDDDTSSDSGPDQDGDVDAQTSPYDDSPNAQTSPYNDVADTNSGPSNPDSSYPVSPDQGNDTPYGDVDSTNSNNNDSPNDDDSANNGTDDNSDRPCKQGDDNNDTSAGSDDKDDNSYPDNQNQASNDEYAQQGTSQGDQYTDSTQQASNDGSNDDDDE